MPREPVPGDEAASDERVPRVGRHRAPDEQRLDTAERREHADGEDVPVDGYREASDHDRLTRERLGLVGGDGHSDRVVLKDPRYPGGRS